MKRLIVLFGATTALAAICLTHPASALFPDPDVAYDAWNRDRVVYGACTSFGSGSLDITDSEASSGELDFPMQINNLGPGDCFYAEVFIHNTTDLAVTVSFLGVSDDGTIAPFLFEWLSESPNDSRSYTWQKTVLQPGESSPSFTLNVGMPLEVGNEAQGTSGSFHYRWQVEEVVVAALEAPVIASPLARSTIINDQRPIITGTGMTGNVVTVTDGDGEVLCTATVGEDGNWSCQSAELAPGPHAISATQVNDSGEVSPVSDIIEITIELFREEVDATYVDPAEGGPSVPNTGAESEGRTTRATPALSFITVAIVLIGSLACILRGSRKRKGNRIRRRRHEVRH